MPRASIVGPASFLALVLLTSAGCHATAAEPGPPATVAEAIKVIDLRTFVPADAKLQGGQPRIGMVMYVDKQKTKAAFDGVRTKLVDAGWTELPGGYQSDDNASGVFSKDGYKVGLSVYTDPTAGASSGDAANVTLINYGNVDTATLPVPEGATKFYAASGSSSYLTEAKLADTVEACRKLLVAAGWVPYGDGGKADNYRMLDFKRNAIHLSASLTIAPAQNNKTSITYSTQVLSADLPVPPGAPDARYNDGDTTMRFDWPSEDGKPVTDFYKTELTKLGWKPTSEKPITDSSKKTAFQIYRNAAGDMISVDLEQFSGIERVKVQHFTKVEVDELDRRATEQAKLANAKRKFEEAKEKMEKEEAAARIAKEIDKPLMKMKKLSGVPGVPDGVEVPDLPEVSSALKELSEAQGNVGAKSKPEAVPGKDAFKAADVAMPAQATKYEYKKTVKMISVESSQSPMELAKFFVNDLTKKGWQRTGRPMVRADGGLVKLERPGAQLTIFIHDRKGGSDATITTKGLNWDEVPASKGE